MTDWHSQMKVSWMRCEDGVAVPELAVFRRPGVTESISVGVVSTITAGLTASLKCILSQIQIVLVCSVMLCAIYRSNIGGEYTTSKLQCCVAKVEPSRGSARNCAQHARV